MSHYLDPISAVTQPRENLIRYLLTAYPLRDVHLRYGFQQLLEKWGNISQHPYVEGSQPYKTGSNLRELVAENILHPTILDLFNVDRTLYQHQELAIKTVVKDNKNIVVATGTGSGKTECFLIPMMDYLLKNPHGGVQALILYPMNALVNDQVKRLRQILCQQSTENHLIRFGFYTSRTETSEKQALEALKIELEATPRDELLALFRDEDNAHKITRKEDLVKSAIEKVTRIQAISREEIWDKPPQILVTNYSMLEHMLIRPKERQEIFESSPHFSLLVVDEAHSYTGSTGTEVSMLIKRLKSAVGIQEEGKMRGIATSATLGDKNKPESKQQIKEFANSLFSESFEDNIIYGDRTSIDERLGKPYPLPEAEIYQHLASLELPSLNDSLDTWQEALSSIVPSHILKQTVGVEQCSTQKNPSTHKHPYLNYCN
ncbi:DEAD/DEAH box helicase [Geminocystis herdmanii]|uniref:DEAD/DEAH box helicase n=1 Tax=Geminocystis herdmanii TaxID=669359 RepID=UPI000344DB48|nr:DEAD/DEAH box helicase [Geminocystis herdmanii]